VEGAGWGQGAVNTAEGSRGRSGGRHRLHPPSITTHRSPPRTWAQARECPEATRARPAGGAAPSPAASAAAAPQPSRVPSRLSSGTARGQAGVEFRGRGQGWAVDTSRVHRFATVVEMLPTCRMAIKRPLVPRPQPLAQCRGPHLVDEQRQIDESAIRGAEHLEIAEQHVRAKQPDGLVDLVVFRAGDIELRCWAAHTGLQRQHCHATELRGILIVESAMVRRLQITVGMASQRVRSSHSLGKRHTLNVVPCETPLWAHARWWSAAAAVGVLLESGRTPHHSAKFGSPHGSVFAF